MQFSINLYWCKNHDYGAQRSTKTRSRRDIARRSHSRSLKVIRCCANRRGIYDFLLALNSNFTSIFNRSWALSPPLHNIQVMVVVWRLRGNINKTALCWIVWHNIHSQQHTYMSSSYRSNWLGLSHWDPYPMRRGGCLELYYCNMVEWFWWDSSLISTTNWFPSVLWHCWFGRLACKSRPEMTYNVLSGTLSLYTQPFLRYHA